MMIFKHNHIASVVIWTAVDDDSVGGGGGVDGNGVW